MHNKIDVLLCTVRLQQETIKVMSEKLNFVLSFLDAPGGLALQGSIRGAVQGSTDTFNSPKSSASSLVESQRAPDQPHLAQFTSYPSAVGVQAGQTRRQPSSFREIVAEAISAEQRASGRRAKSVIVTGLTMSADTNDKMSFKRLCMKELSIESQITFTRRLGGDKGCVRPLLVGLRSEHDVSTLLSRAKTLRQSSTEAVRKSIYINRNLSKEEARLAYEARRRRRHHQQQNHHDVQQSVDVSLSAGAAEFVPTSATVTTAAVHTTSAYDAAGRHP